jgi:hypothetical protein
MLLSAVSGALFQSYLAYSTSSSAGDKTIPGGFDDRRRDQMKIIDAENLLDLGKYSSR